MDTSVERALLLDHIEKLQILLAVVCSQASIGRGTLLVLKVVLVVSLQTVIDSVVIVLNDALFMRIRRVVSNQIGSM